MSSFALHGNKLQIELTGNTLEVYWYLFKKKQNPTGVREIQRVIGFSSSSSADYHLQKLMEMGLVRKDPFGNYRVNRSVKVGVMKSFLFMGGLAFPKHLLYSIFTSAVILVFLMLFKDALSPVAFIALTPGISAAVIFWYETFSVWRNAPSRLIRSINPEKRSKV